MLMCLVPGWIAGRLTQLGRAIVACRIDDDRVGLARTRGMATAILGCTLLVGTPVTAGAATVSVHPRPDPGYADDVLVFQAQPSERNVVWARSVPAAGSVAAGRGGWEITDTGAVIDAGEPCRALAAHTVYCPERPGRSYHTLDVSLGDLDDSFYSTGPLLTPGADLGLRGMVVADGGLGDDELVGGTVHENAFDGGDGNDVLRAVGEDVLSGASSLDGGPGNDRLFGSPQPDDLDGGGGRDQLYGRGGDDFMVDGDSDTANGDAGPGPDLIIGGEDSCDLPYNLNNSCGGDMVSYSGRNGSVSVDLADRRPDGQPGERDSVGDVESIEGGSGADRLFGDEHSNTLVGGPGRDRLTGRGGRDEFYPGGIEETGRGRPGPWKPPARATADTVSCGGGSFDNVRSPRRITLVGRGCEQVSWSGGDYFRPYPKPIRGGFLEYKVPACPYAETDGMRVPRCRGRVRLAEASGRHRTLAAMAIPFRRAVGGTEYAVPRLEIPLTALGRRLAATRRKVRATLQIDYESRGGSVRFAWRIEL